MNVVVEKFYASQNKGSRILFSIKYQRGKYQVVIPR